MTKEKHDRKRLLLIIVCFFWFMQYVYIPYQTTYLLSIGTSYGVAGLVVGAYGFVQIFLRIPVGILADNYGKHKKIIAAGILCVGFACLIRVLMPTATGFFIANLFSGLGASTWISFMVLFMSYYGDDQIHTATGVVLAANNTGVLLGFIFSSMLYTKLGMRHICAFSVGVALVCSILVTRVMDNNTKAEAVQDVKVTGKFRYDKLLFFSFLALIQQGIQMATCMSFTISRAGELGANDLQTGITTIIYIVFAVIFARLSGTAFFTKIGNKKMIFGGMVAQLLYCILVPNMKSFYGIYGCQILAAVAMGFLFTSLTAESLDGVPRNKRSTAQGIFQAIYAVGMTVFPIVTGSLLKNYGIKCAYYFMGSCIVIGLCAVTFYYYRKKVCH
ncbi:MAG: MFS transporter [Lachnospiraceae bacterium]|nr:MFS transporter [Lachnospiraceae bacterium]